MAAPIVRILDSDAYEAEIARAAEILGGGGIVVLPTETVYGAAGVLNNRRASERLHQLRGEGQSRPFTLHLAHREQAQRYIDSLSDYGKRLMAKLWPGPVALVFDVPEQRRREVAAEIGVGEADLYEQCTITLRCPDHAVATDVIGRIDGPVVLTTAAAPGEAAERASGLGASVLEKVDLVLDAGPSRYSRPSTILKVQADGYRIMRAGIYDERIIERLLRTTILFVCSGNTCRSPMAEAIARRLIADKVGIAPEELEKKGISVMSVGSMAMPGTRAAEQAVEAVRSIGADLTRHRSRSLSIELVNQADLILTMGRSHAQAVRALVPSAADKVVAVDPAGDIEDPIGGDAALYKSLAWQLQGLIEQRLREKGIL